jgi:hypothetical protein
MPRVFFFFILTIIVCSSISSQEPILIVKEFEYIWEKEYGSASPGGQKRVILAEVDSIRNKISESFAHAFQRRWNMSLPAFSISVKPLGFFSNEPKFNTRLKDKNNNTWYLFLQLFDKRSNVFSEDEKLSGYLTAKCKLVNGDDEKAIHEKNLVIAFYKEETPPDQLTLFNLPGYPPSYIRAFDSIAQWLFQAEPVINKSVKLEAACIFDEAKAMGEVVQTLSFETNGESIKYTGPTPFSFKTEMPVIKRVDARRNRGGNIAGGALTVLTGISTNKSRQYDYEADFSFTGDDTAYHCIINYTERETGSRERVKDESSNSYSFNSSGYGLQDRFIDTSSLNFIRLGNDTIAVFTVQYEKIKDPYSTYSKMWNGKDSSSVLGMTENWNNKGVLENIVIKGQMNDVPFKFKCVKDKKVKLLYIADKAVAMIYGKNFPLSGAAYQPVTERQLKIFTILSYLPYTNFNIHMSE